MKNKSNILFKVISFLGMAVLAYGALFLFWIMLMYGCTENHSVTECRDNTLTFVVTYPFNLFNN